MQQYIPGADSPDNNKYAEQAIDEFKKVLDDQSSQRAEASGAEGHCLALLQHEEDGPGASEYQLKVAELDPNDPEAYYSIGVIDWTQAYQPRLEARAKLGLKPTDDPKGQGLHCTAEAVKDNNAA